MLTPMLGSGAQPVDLSGLLAPCTGVWICSALSRISCMVPVSCVSVPLVPVQSWTGTVIRQVVDHVTEMDAYASRRRCFAADAEDAIRACATSLAGNGIIGVNAVSAVGHSDLIGLPCGRA